ncbi:Hypothetical protein POVR2_LOCUS243 [uncultured virus]|nr:Hypothetical protein POVR2_LOCUS243 [uncultured virus]
MQSLCLHPNYLISTVQLWHLPIDILAEICATLDGQSLLVCKQTSLWFYSLLRRFSTSEFFWKARVEHHLQFSLSDIVGLGWKQAYNFYDKQTTIPNLLVVDIMSYSGYDFSRCNYRCLQESASDGNLEVTVELWQLSREHVSSRIARVVLSNAVRSGNAKLVADLLSDRLFVDKKIDVLQAVCEASYDLAMIECAIQVDSPASYEAASKDTILQIVLPYILLDRTDIALVLLGHCKSYQPLILDTIVYSVVNKKYKSVVLLSLRSKYLVAIAVCYLAVAMLILWLIW